MFLHSIESPSDIKKMSLKDLETLCFELRSEIVRITMKNGGHLGSNLGTVELIVAMHYVFDCPVDKFIFDVGHQSYVHKFLTNRKDLMENLRQENGTTGFPNRTESEYDSFIGGHASTSLSASIGIAKGRDLKNEKFNILCLLGDGSLSGGMIYEALNNVSNIKDFIVILNDNQMSISRSVGAMKKHLSKLLLSKSGLLLRKKISKLLRHRFRFVEKIIKNSISSIKGWNIFEEFGLQYLGPIDGHNLKELIELFQNLKEISNHKPVIVHAITQKGKGHAAAEKDKSNMHGIGKTLQNSYTDVFGQHLAHLAKYDEKIVAITAAMKSGTGLSLFAQQFPSRFFDVGIAESHAVTFAAGLATEGFKPYVAIYSTFLQRAFDQIYHDVVLQNLPVRFVIDRAGFPGPDGKTHAGIYDISMLQNFPNMTILSPSSKQELVHMLNFSQNHAGPLAIRFPKASANESIYNQHFDGNFKIVLQGEGVLILSIGNLLCNVYEAIDISKTKPTVIDVRVIQPFPFAEFFIVAEKYQHIVILEEGVFGGFATLLMENLIVNKMHDILSKIVFVTASKVPTTSSVHLIQQESSGLSAEKIAETLIDLQHRSI